MLRRAALKINYFHAPTLRYCVLYKYPCGTFTHERFTAHCDDSIYPFTFSLSLLTLHHNRPHHVGKLEPPVRLGTHTRVQVVSSQDKHPAKSYWLKLSYIDPLLCSILSYRGIKMVALTGLEPAPPVSSVFTSTSVLRLDYGGFGSYHSYTIAPQ